MKTILVLILNIILIVITGWARPYTDYDATVTRDLSGNPLPSRSEYLEMFPEGDFNYEIVNLVAPHRDEEGTVVLVINRDLHTELEDRFDIWVDDLGQEGYRLVQIVSEGGSAQEFKDMIIDEGGDDLVGCIFAGELPLAWYEHLEYFDNENEPDNQIVEQYPLDLFFMDLDGIWEDTTGNGIYDHHYGEVDPDIWVGRLPAYNLNRIEEVPFVAAYLDRIHAYRAGELTLSHRALNYIDDDWIQLEDDWTSDLSYLFGRVITDAHPDSTSAEGFVNHLEGEGYEFVQVAVHSTSDSHVFFVNEGQQRDYFRYFDLRDDVEANTQFYNLFACTSMNMAGQRNLCMGVLYAMAGPNHLGAVGPTKTGSMLFFDDYYRPLQDGVNFGEALRLWLVEHAQDRLRPNWARSWFYSMVHYGDPTLKIKQGLRTEDVVFADEAGDDDYVPDAGETIELWIRTVNHGDVELRDVNLIVSSADTNITIFNDEIQFELIEPGEAISADGIIVELSASLTDKHKIPLEITMHPAAGDIWFGSVIIPVRAPRLETTGFAWTEIGGNGNNIIEHGESGVLSIQFRNNGGDHMHSDGEIEIISLDDSFIFGVETGRLRDVAPEETGSMIPAAFEISAEDRNQTTSYLLVRNVVQGVLRGEGILALPISTDFQFNEQLNEDPVWLRHYSVTPEFADDWRWLEDGGEDSGGIAFGGPELSEYPAHADAAFELPLMNYAENAILTIRHRVDIEPEYDAAVIEVDRGEGWRKINPRGGYNGDSVPNGDYEGGACWNGTFDWQTDALNLGRTAGPLRVRIRFSSDAGVEGNGWFIDRIQIDGEPLTTTPIELEPYSFELNGIYPNPFNHRFSIDYTLPAAGKVSLKMYNLRSELTATALAADGIAGVNSMSINAQELPSGIYFIRLEYGSHALGMKAVLLK